MTTFEGFQDGLPAWIVRPDRTPVENLMVEHRALSNVGDPYHLGADNCEHDMTFAQTGVATSSTLNTVLGRTRRPRHPRRESIQAQTESPATSPVSQSILSIELIEFDLIEEDEDE